jgi:glycosyltransferase involved in cell wall biosynthesis
MEPLISIITVTYNASAMIEETIESVLKQSFTNYEFWIIDGASTDNTLEILKRYSGKLNYVSQADEGIYHAMNKGIARTTGTWLYFLNSGDTLHDHHVLQRIFETDIPADVELIYGNIHTKNHPSGSDYTIGREVSLSNFHYRVGLCHQAAFTKRSAFKTLGDYQYKVFPILADQEWFVRFFKAGRNSLYKNLTVAYYEVVGESYVRRIENHWDHLRIVKQHFSPYVRFQNRLRSPFVILKIKLLKLIGGSRIYKWYRSVFFND